MDDFTAAAVANGWSETQLRSGAPCLTRGPLTLVGKHPHRDVIIGYNIASMSPFEAPTTYDLDAIIEASNRAASPSQGNVGFIIPTGGTP